MGKGQELWERAKRLIPGGNMLLSKRAEMFLPSSGRPISAGPRAAASGTSTATQYIDMSIMGIGYQHARLRHPEVDAAVAHGVENGNMSTLNCPEEVYLAERLVELHPWADMARFARTGGEANAVAIRIARAATGRDKVAFCGYHGWHDWYLAANLGDDSARRPPAARTRPERRAAEPARHRPSLRLQRARRRWRRSMRTEHRRHQDGGVAQLTTPQPGFLAEGARARDEHGIVLIFDECTSGFRQTFGGLHKHYGVEPDMAMFGKALGNGYAITGRDRPPRGHGSGADHLHQLAPSGPSASAPPLRSRRST